MEKIENVSIPNNEYVSESMADVAIDTIFREKFVNDETPLDADNLNTVLNAIERNALNLKALVNELNSKQLSKANQEITSLQERVAALEDDNSQDAGSGGTVSLENYYDKNIIDGKVEVLENAVKAAKQSADDAQKDMDTFMGLIDSDTDAIDTLNEVINLINSFFDGESYTYYIDGGSAMDADTDSFKED